MITRNSVFRLFRSAIALFCVTGITISAIPGRSETMPDFNAIRIEAYTNADLWQYLRTGLNYLEASGKEVPIDYKHPGGKAYGPLAITAIAVEDVKIRYPALSGHELGQVLSEPALYEKFAVLYADLLLRHYLKMDYSKMPKEEVFKILEKAWFLGPTLYKEGGAVIGSREEKARQYVLVNSLTAPRL